MITHDVRGIVAGARGLADRLAAREPEAREVLADIAETARATLADVRGVLGILRRDDHAPLLAPPAAEPARPAPAAAPAPDVIAREVTPAATVVGRRRAPGAARDPRRADRLLAAALLLGAEIELTLVAPSGSRPAAAIGAVLIVAPLLWRRHRPVAVALAVLVAISLQSAVLSLESFPVSDIAALIVASCSIGAHAGGRRAIAGLVLVALGAAGHAFAFHPEGVAAALIGGTAFPWTVGRILRSQRLVTAGHEERTARAERERGLRARAAMVAERSRVARELHDVVAHGISVIAIQAAGAHDLAGRDPQRAAEAATLIETVGSDALAELERLFGPPGGEAATAEPQPSLARVAGLAHRARDGGLPVELHVEGTPAALPAGIDLAAYRIIQEALANTSKHAGGARATIVVRYHPREIELEISDDGDGPNAHRAGSPSDGHGLIGMRERTALYGGSLDAGRRASGGFRVRASLPIGRG